MIRPGRSASPRVWVKHGGPKSLKDRRRSADTVSWASNVVVVDVVTSGKWLVNLTGEVPLRPPACESSDGKPMYKSTTKAAAMRQDMKQRLHPPREFHPVTPGLARQPVPASLGPQQIRSSPRRVSDERRNLILVRPKRLCRGSELAAAWKDHQMICPCSARPGHQRGTRLRNMGKRPVDLRAAVTRT